ncbi:hypothetical protein [Clostridium cadaveris]|uniref:hypothetical protein n=1 Tax=Clostridium cadaveris TaxID=1529 RepID=UPI000419D112|nr:hypothetical protein [Clostridium cadaveris]NME63609.1 hypothetical protein [Clostridium cadaveris]NWK09883.1 hypothetical protein [Clostridium cadaveris]
MNKKIIKKIVLLSLVIIMIIFLFKIFIPSYYTYNNEKLRISLKLPNYWRNRCIFKEENDSIYSYYISKESNKKALLFAIVKLDSNDNPIDGEIYDSIGRDIIFHINGNRYRVGATTDVGFPNDNIEYQNYIKMKSQISEIVKTMEISSN